MTKLETKLQNSVAATLELMGLEGCILDDKQTPEGFWESVSVYLKKRGIKRSPKSLENLFYDIKNRKEDPIHEQRTEPKIFKYDPNLNKYQRRKQFEENINIFKREVIRLAGEELDPKRLDEQFDKVSERIKDDEMLNQIESLTAEFNDCHKERTRYGKPKMVFQLGMKEIKELLGDIDKKD